MRLRPLMLICLRCEGGPFFYLDDSWLMQILESFLFLLLFYIFETVVSTFSVSWMGNAMVGLPSLTCASY